MYSGCWPARLGQSGVTLLPSTPWHAAQVADFARPASTEPCAAGFGWRLALRGAGAASCAHAIEPYATPKAVVTSAVANDVERQISRSSDARSRWTIPIDFTRKPAADCTLRPGSEREPRPRRAHTDLHQERRGARGFSSGRRPRSRVRRPLELRQVDRAESARGRAQARAREQDAGTHAAREFFRDRRAAAPRRFAGLRIRARAAGTRRSVGESSSRRISRRAARSSESS